MAAADNNGEGMKRFIALIPAAGVGERFGADKPKQYVEIAGKTVLQHTLEIFLHHAKIHQVAVVLSPNDTFFQALPHEKLMVLRCGGNTRAESVRNGIKALLVQGLADEADGILVHDAARCCLSSTVLNRLLHEAGDKAEGGILAIPVADTLKRTTVTGQIETTVLRTNLWQAQTPQLFQVGLLQRALDNADLSVITDEASAVEQLGIQPWLVLGDICNLKLTLPQDEGLVRLLLEREQ